MMSLKLLNVTTHYNQIRSGYQKHVLCQSIRRTTSSSSTYSDGVDRTIIRLNRYRSTLAKRSNFCVSMKAQDAILSHRYISSPWKKAIEIARLSCLGPSSSCDLSLSFALFPRAIVTASVHCATEFILLRRDTSDGDRSIYLVLGERSQSSKGMVRKLQSALP